MGIIINFLVDNYIFVVFFAILLVLALIGYIVDTSKTNKLRSEFSKTVEPENGSIPIAILDASVKLGDTVNKMAMTNEQNVNAEVKRSPLDTGK